MVSWLLTQMMVYIGRSSITLYGWILSGLLEAWYLLKFFAQNENLIFHADSQKFHHEKKPFKAQKCLGHKEISSLV